jgi:LytR cell envelope-related transcriptional attenuator
VDHPLPQPETLVRSWQKATLVATAIAALELVLLIVLGGALLARDAASPDRKPAPKPAREPAPAAARRPATPAAAKPELRRRNVAVLVLNGNGHQGAAAAAARRIHVRGYRIDGVANAPHMDYTRTLIMYRRGFEGEGLRLARDLGIALVGPLDGMRPRDLKGAHAVVVVGA